MRFRDCSRAGFGVLGAMTRGGGNDVYVEHEEMLLDMAACIRFLKEKSGVEQHRALRQ